MNTKILQKIIKDLHKFYNPKKIEIFKWFFKTGKGQYGAGDIFWGLNSQQIKSVAKTYFKEIDFATIKKLLYSKIHEQRMCAVRILVYKYEKAIENEKQEIFKFYLANAKQVNNWDLVDTSAPNIVGDYLLTSVKTHFFVETHCNASLLCHFAHSKNLWEKRIAIISTLAFIRANKFGDTLKIAKILLKDKHDLIHKAVGWMLREVGKRNEQKLENFLDANAKIMPRTMLRYAIEKLPEEKRKYYLNRK